MTRTEELEKEIRRLYCDQGPLERGDVVPLLIALLGYIGDLEAQVAYLMRRDTE